MRLEMARACQKDSLWLIRHVGRAAEDLNIEGD
jgi:hypothetical protein